MKKLVLIGIKKKGSPWKYTGREGTPREDLEEYDREERNKTGKLSDFDNKHAYHGGSINKKI